MHTGILLVNLGTPSQPTSKAVREFLTPFLLDKNVVDLNRLIWYPLLNCIILPRRVPTVAKLYAKIWLDDGSPLLVYTQNLARALQEKTHLPVEISMTYGQPSLQSGIEKLRAQHVQEIILLPLYPQYSTTTTRPVWQQIHQLQEQYTQISFKKIENYGLTPTYIQALAQSVTQFWHKNGPAQVLLCSYHGLPKRYVAQREDTYAKTCVSTTHLLQQELALDSDKIFHSYQSRFGKEEWLTPYTVDTIRHLAQSGITHLDIIAPSFACDCLETLHELAIEGQEVFQAAGGEVLRLIPALNDSPLHVDALACILNL